MRSIFCFFLCFLSLYLFGQADSVSISTINGVVCTKYKKNNFGLFCEQQTFIYTNRDTLLFYQQADFNMTMLKLYPSFSKIIGSAKNYESDYIYCSLNGIFEHDLTISPFNYHFQDSNSNSYLISSTSFFVKINDNYLYSTYNFTGDIIVYSFLKKMSRQNKDCLCKLEETEVNKFAVLKKVQSLSPLTDIQILDLKLIRSGIKTIFTFYSE